MCMTEIMNHALSLSLCYLCDLCASAVKNS
jgi:hypothetical protein